MTLIKPEIKRKINQIQFTGDKLYAAFDLDNTLLYGDIGDAVFASLLNKGLIQGFNWKDYLALLIEDRETAYRKVVEVLHGLPIEALKTTTHEVIDSNLSFIQIDQAKVPVPRPNPTMQSIINLIEARGIELFVVTASNEVSAGIICQKHFNIPTTNVLGIQVGISKPGIIAYEPTEIPFGIGKVNALKRKYSHRPVVTGGDGVWDKFLLDYTRDDGIRFWAGQDVNEYQLLKDDYYPNLAFYHIQS